MRVTSILLKSAAFCVAIAYGCAFAQNQTSPNEWKDKYPLQYYSMIAGNGTIDDPTDPNLGYSHGLMGVKMMQSINNSKGKGLNATCLSCKSARFNDIYKKFGNEVFLGQKSPKYTDMMRMEDFWSCETCHSDMSNPKASAGAQIMNPKLFGKELFDKLPPKTAACAQCHNNLAPWSDSRIIVGMQALNEGKTAYRYGWDPDAMIKATFEDAMPSGVRFPTAKVYETSRAAHAKFDKDTGIYLIANGNHADAELFMDSLHYKMGMGCADCHMPMNTDRAGKTYRSHASSMPVSGSREAMQYCLTCHKNEKVKNPKDMVNFLREAQKDVASRDKIVADKLDQTFPMLKQAIIDKKLPAETLEKAKLNYATASYYKEYVHGNRGATPGEKVAHNPEMSRKYLDKASALLDETQAMLKN